MSDIRSPQVSWTLLSILADLNNAVVWMVSTRPLIFKSSSLCINPFVTVPSVPITIGITVTFMFHNFFCSLARFKCLSPFSLSFSFTLILVDLFVYTFPGRVSATVDASFSTLFCLTGVQTGLVFSYSAAQSCPTLTKLWFSLFLSVPVSCCRW